MSTRAMSGLETRWAQSFQYLLIRCAFLSSTISWQLRSTIEQRTYFRGFGGIALPASSVW
jgi:hypothetical protein